MNEEEEILGQTDDPYGENYIGPSNLGEADRSVVGDLATLAGSAAVVKAAPLAINGLTNLAKKEWSMRTLTNAAHAQLKATGKVTPTFTNGWPTGYRPLNALKWGAPGGLQTGPTQGVKDAANVALLGIPTVVTGAAKVLPEMRRAVEEIITNTHKFDLPNPFKLHKTLPDFVGGTGAGMNRKVDGEEFFVDPVKPKDITDPTTPRAAHQSPAAEWGSGNLIDEVWKNSLDEGERISELTNYNKGGRANLSKWAREEFVPLMEAAANELGMPIDKFYSFAATKHKFKYIEHRIAKTKALQWYWEMQGDPNIPWDVKANNIDNLRLLFDDRFKKLKDAVEVQIYGGSTSKGGINSAIPVKSQRYIVDIQKPEGSPKFTAKSIEEGGKGAGDVVIKKLLEIDGKKEWVEVGRIGEYYNVLYSNTDDLLQPNALPRKFPELLDMTKGQKETWIREWRTEIINDHLDIIRRKEVNLQGFSPRERFEKIEDALNADMVDFRAKYDGVLPFMNEAEWTRFGDDWNAEQLIKNKQLIIDEVGLSGPNIKTTVDSSFKKIKQTVKDIFKVTDEELTGPFPPKTEQRKIYKKKRLKGGGPSL